VQRALRAASQPFWSFDALLFVLVYALLLKLLPISPCRYHSLQVLCPVQDDFNLPSRDSAHGGFLRHVDHPDEALAMWSSTPPLSSVGLFQPDSRVGFSDGRAHNGEGGHHAIGATVLRGGNAGAGDANAAPRACKTERRDGPM
jgi:hypothetical protein